MQKINEVEIKSGTKCYWILNNSNNEKYTLFNANATEYTLATGESFLYTNKELTQLYILGAGTKITRSLKTSNMDTLGEWSVDVLESELDPTQEGLNAFDENDWFVIPDDVNCSVTEQAFYSIGKDTIVTLQGAQSGMNGSYFFTNSGFSLGNVLPSDFKNFNISFEYNGEVTVLPRITSERLKWSGKSVLSLNMSNTEPQILLDRQSVTFTDKDGTPYPLGDVDDGDNYTPLYMLSNVPMYLDGGININTTLLNSAGETNYLAIYAYNYQVGNNNSLYTVTTDGGVSVKLSNFVDEGDDNPTSVDVSINYKIPEGRYLMTIEKSKDTVTSIYNLSFGTKPSVKTLNFSNTETPDNNNTKILYVMVDSVGDGDLTSVSFTCQGGIADGTVEIKPLIRLDEAINETLLKSIQQLDPGQLYDYTYVVDEYDEIENPLDPYSLFRDNHIYNPFMICQLDTIKLKIQNRVR